MDDVILRDLGILLVGAVIVALAARPLRVPAIVAYILAGLALGPGLGVVTVSEAVETVSEAGIVLLLFIVGLELSLAKIREVGGVAIAAGALQIAGTGIGIATIAWAFGRPPTEIAFLAVALTFSSTVVVVKLLDQLEALGARHGRVAVGILLVQDLAVILALTFVGGLSADDGVQAAVLARAVATSFAAMVGLLAVAVGISTVVLPALFRRAASSQETLLVWSLTWCFLLVSGAGFLGLSLELGAFVAGVTLAQLPYSHDLRRRVHPLMSFFVAIFFVTLGVHMELGAVAASWPIVLALSVFTLVLKPTLVGWLVRMAGERPRVALRAGVTLGQTSEFSFILAGMAVSLALVDAEVLAIVGGVGLLTMGLSSITILNGNRLVEWAERMGILRFLCGAAAEGPPLDADGAAAHMRGHVIVVGMNSLGRRIVELLAAEGVSTLALDTDPDKLAGLACRTLHGNAEYLSVLDEAGLDDAELLVSALRIESVNRILAYRARTHGVPAVIHAYDRSTEQELEALGVAHLVDSRAAGIQKIAEALRTEGVFGR